MASKNSTDSPIDGLKTYVQDTLLFLGDYTPILESYVNDFFLNDLYQNIPDLWWDLLVTLEPAELASLLSSNTWKSKKPWPLSLLAFRCLAHQLSFPRRPVKVTQEMLKSLDDAKCDQLKVCEQRRHKGKRLSTLCEDSNEEADADDYDPLRKRKLDVIYQMLKTSLGEANYEKEDHGSERKKLTTICETDDSLYNEYKNFPLVDFDSSSANSTVESRGSTRLTTVFEEGEDKHHRKDVDHGNKKEDNKDTSTQLAIRDCDESLEPWLSSPESANPPNLKDYEFKPEAERESNGFLSSIYNKARSIAEGAKQTYNDVKDVTSPELKTYLNSVKESTNGIREKAADSLSEVTAAVSRHLLDDSIDEGTAIDELDVKGERERFLYQSDLQQTWDCLEGEYPVEARKYMTKTSETFNNVSELSHKEARLIENDINMSYRNFKAKLDMDLRDFQTEMRLSLGGIHDSDTESQEANGEIEEANALLGDVDEYFMDEEKGVAVTETSRTLGELPKGSVKEVRAIIHEPKSVTRDGQLLQLEHCYKKHVKPKKQHEIKQLSEVIKELSDKCDCKHVVDVGAGQGHLSRLLSFGYGMNVTTVEAVDCHAPKAQKFDREVQIDFEKGLAKMYGKNCCVVSSNESSDQETSFSIPEVKAPNHVIAKIDSNTSVLDFLDKLDLTHKIKGYEAKLTMKPKVVGATCKELTQELENGMSEAGDGSEGGGVVDTYMKTQPQENAESVPLLRRRVGANKQRFWDTLSDDQKEAELQRPLIGPGDISPPQVLSAGELVIAGLQNGDSSHPKTIVETYDSDSSDEEDDIPPFILTGLHACGDLTPTMLRVFVECPQAVGLASVSCCYMKMTTPEKKKFSFFDDDGDGDVFDSPSQSSVEDDFGYPMSSFVKQFKYHHLSWEAREVACHFVESFHRRLLNPDDLPKLKVQCYRAILQEIILEKNPDACVGSTKVTIKRAEELSFKEYAEKALKKLSFDPYISGAQLAKAEERLKKWRHLIAYYTLRLALAPVLETLVLLDRVIFLAEQGIQSMLIPIFDPDLSPRNFVVLAKKKTLSLTKSEP